MSTAAAARSLGTAAALADRPRVPALDDALRRALDVPVGDPMTTRVLHAWLDGYDAVRADQAAAALRADDTVTVTLTLPWPGADGCDAAMFLGAVRAALVGEPDALTWLHDRHAGALVGMVAVTSREPDEPYRHAVRLP